jgi:hypothetical protein
VVLIHILLVVIPHIAIEIAAEKMKFKEKMKVSKKR